MTLYDGVMLSGAVLLSFLLMLAIQRCSHEETVERYLANSLAWVDPGARLRTLAAIVPIEVSWTAGTIMAALSFVAPATEPGSMWEIVVVLLGAMAGAVLVVGINPRCHGVFLPLAAPVDPATHTSAAGGDGAGTVPLTY